VTLQNRNAMQKKSDVCIPNFRAHHLKKQNKTRPDKTRKQTKASKNVNKNNPAQNFFSIAQFPTKKQHPFLFFL